MRSKCSAVDLFSWWLMCNSYIIGWCNDTNYPKENFLYGLTVDYIISFSYKSTKANVLIFTWYRKSKEKSFTHTITKEHLLNMATITPENQKNEVVSKSVSINYSIDQPLVHVCARDKAAFSIPVCLTVCISYQMRTNCYISCIQVEDEGSAV